MCLLCHSHCVSLALCLLCHSALSLIDLSRSHVVSTDAPDGISSITILCGTAYNAASQASELVITSRNTATGGEVDVWSGSQCVQVSENCY